MRAERERVNENERKKKREIKLGGGWVGVHQGVGVDLGSAISPSPFPSLHRSLTLLLSFSLTRSFTWCAVSNMQSCGQSERQVERGKVFPWDAALF